MTGKSGKRPTMKDVAQEAGVTQATVSYVINSTCEISEPVKKRVREAAAMLGYVPNIYARNLKTNKSNTIGVIVPDVLNSYYAEMINQTERLTRGKGYFTFICNTMHESDIEDWYINSLIQQKVAGVIVCYGLTNKTCLKKLNRYMIPFVVLDDELAEGEAVAPCILLNNVKGSFLAVQHFVSMGIADIAYCSEPLYNLALKDRLDGFNRAIIEFGLQKQSDLIYLAPEKGETNKITLGYIAAGELLKQRKVQGIFASSDQIAFGVIKKLLDMKIKVPEEIAVIGYDNVPFSSVISPGLTTINQPVVPMCMQGINILMNIITGITDRRKKITLEPNIIIRESAPYY